MVNVAAAVEVMRVGVVRDTEIVRGLTERGAMA